MKKTNFFRRVMPVLALLVLSLGSVWAEDISKTFNLAYSATEAKSADWTLTESPVTLGMSKGTAQNVPSPNKEGSLRFYAGTTLTISTTTGTLKTVEFTYTTASYPAAFTYSAQAISTEDNSTAKTNTWTVPAGQTSVVLAATAACRFSKIVVTYTTSDGGSTPQPTALSAPANLASSNVSTTGATLSWDAVANASSYTVKIGETEYTGVNTTSYNATGLTANTSYTWTVKAVGDGVNYSTSDYAANANFMTAEEPIASNQQKITYNFNDKNAYPASFPTATGTKTTTPTSFNIGGNNLIISAPDAYYIINNTTQNRGLFFGKTTAANNKPSDGTAYLGFPAISGKKLVKVVATTTSGVAGSVKMNIYDASWNTYSTELSTTASTKKSFTFNLTNTTENTEYRLTSGSSGKNLQFDNIVLTYEDAAPAKTVTGIAVKTAPTTTTYFEGQKFHPAGLVITATYDDESTEDIAYAGNESKFTFSPATETALQTSNTAVTITYGGQNCNQAITVSAKKDPSIEFSCAGNPGNGTEETPFAFTIGENNTYPTAIVKYGDAAVTGAAVTYSTTNSAYIDVNSSTGALTLKKYASSSNKVRVTINYAGNEEYNACSATYYLTITKGTPVISFAEPTLSVAKDAENAGLAAVVDAKYGALTITYTSNNTEVADFADANSPVLTLKKTGTATISAQSVTNDAWKQSEKVTYALTVTSAVPKPQVYYELIPNETYLEDGAEYIIAVKRDANNYVAMTSNLDQGYFDAVNVSASNNIITNINGAAVWTAEAESGRSGYQDVAFKIGSNYINYSSSFATLTNTKEAFSIVGYVNVYTSDWAFLAYNNTDAFTITNNYSMDGSICFFKKVERVLSTFDLTISAVGFSTFYDSQKAYTLPEGMSAFVANLNGTTLEFEEVYTEGNVIPAGEPVILKADADDYTLVEGTTSRTTYKSFEMNILDGHDEAGSVSSGDDELDNEYYFYALSLNASGAISSVGFYWMVEGGAPFNLGAHKAYLVLTKDLFAEGNAPIRFLFHTTDTATDVENIGAEKAIKFFENDQVIILRDGVRYNVLGQKIQ